MEAISETLARIGAADKPAITSDGAFDVDEYEARVVRRYNASRGALDQGDGYDCPLCLNRGDSMRAYRDAGGVWREVYDVCECAGIRRNIERLARSGLREAVARQRLDNYAARDAYQRRILETARRYLDGSEPGRWFFIGGAVGCGKTHICTAIAGELIRTEDVLYIVWPDESAEIKALTTDAEAYAARVGRLKRASTLYIDDLFKTTRDRDGRVLPPSGPDVRLAHEILNSRYAAEKKTVLSSERYLDEIRDIDDAIGGRIAQRARGYALSITRNASRDYRLRSPDDMV